MNAAEVNRIRSAETLRFAGEGREVSDRSEKTPPAPPDMTP